jgi:hypothetical protein
VLHRRPQIGVEIGDIHGFFEHPVILERKRRR